MCVHVVELDEGVVMQLASMGFDIEGCKRAVFHTHNQGTCTSMHCNIIPLRCGMAFHLYLCSFSCCLGVEPAMQWVLEHMADPGKN